MKLDLILIGGGGHCKSCIDVIEFENKFNIIGILDLPINVGNKINNYEIIGIDNDIEKYLSKNVYFFITIGQIENVFIRKKLFNQLIKFNAKIATIISPSAYVSTKSKVGIGTIIMHKCVINSGVMIGDNSIINTLSNIEHDVKIGNHTHISTGAMINGDCIIGNEVFVGSNSTISNQIKISDKSIIGAASYVNRDIEKADIYAGIPVTKIKSQK